jgi:hypothetical protein
MECRLCHSELVPGEVGICMGCADHESFDKPPCKPTEHKWVKKYMGGSPDTAEASEVVELCDECGAEAWECWECGNKIALGDDDYCQFCGNKNPEPTR